MEFSLAFSFLSQHLSKLFTPEDVAFTVYLFATYHHFLVAKEVPRAAIRMRIIACLRLLAFCKIPIWKISTEDFLMWFHHMEAKSRLSSATQRHYVGYVHGFYEHVMRKVAIIQAKHGVSVEQIVTIDAMLSILSTPQAEIR